MIDTGPSLVVATVAPDGSPHAARAWGWSVVDDDAPRLRIAIEYDDPDNVSDLVGCHVAVTGCDVSTLRSVQIKGRIMLAELPGDTDLERVDRYTQVFFDDVYRTDHDPLQLLRRIMPIDLAMIELVVEETFDQSPGPTAGSPVNGDAR